MNPQALADLFATQTYGETSAEAVSKSLCLSCKQSATTFKDQVSANEYQTTGFCQSCQDQVFADYSNDE